MSEEFKNVDEINKEIDNVTKLIFELLDKVDSNLIYDVKSEICDSIMEF